MRRSTRNESYRLKGGGPAQQSLFGPGAYASAGALEILNTSVLKSGQNYQRPVSKQAVDKLVRQWDDLLFEPPVVHFYSFHCRKNPLRFLSRML